jgi:hypothetical protein
MVNEEQRRTNEWGIIAVRNFFDDWMLNTNCVDTAIATSLTVEHGFTNVQFVALAAAAMLEWVVTQPERTMRDYGLKQPWYWDTFLHCLDHGNHAMHLGTWFWRPTLFWKSNAGVSKAERRWLNEKYPSWEDSWGVL